MNERLAEMRFLESLDDLRKSGVSVELFAVPHAAVGKSDAPFLSTAKKVTIKLKPSEDWGLRG